jgi:hypothetical protein
MESLQIEPGRKQDKPTFLSNARLTYILLPRWFPEPIPPDDLRFDNVDGLVARMVPKVLEKDCSGQ